MEKYRSNTGICFLHIPFFYAEKQRRAEETSFNYERRTTMKFDLCTKLHESTPLVHCITNYVTVNDCANILLASGGSPIMADEPAEAAEMTAICSGLVINIGTLNSRTIPAMLEAGKAAHALGHPVLLDPVGAGATKLRTETAVRILEEVHPDVIRGNISEMKALAGGSATTRGVDAAEADKVTEENLAEVTAWAKALAAKTGAVIAITGAIDIVADGEKAYIIRNGHPIMASITGSGCMLSAYMGAAICAKKENKTEGAAQCLCAMGVAGERAYAKLQKLEGGNSTYRDLLIDEIYKMTDDVLAQEARYEVR